MNPESQNNTQILVVEDDPSIVQLLTMTLTNLENWIISSVDCGAKGVFAWSNGDFDVIIMDIGLPGMDGITATKKIRTMEAAGNLTKTPIIALTAQSDSIHECLEAGMDEFLSKPFSTRTLIETIKRYL
jgi:CheY-like chemotaxis protein